MNELDEQLKDFLIEKSSEILKINEEEVEWEADLDEYGFESMKINKLCLDLNKAFGIEIRPAIFLEYTSLSEFGDYLKKTFYQKVESVLLT
ncbi:acyl carrier protein [Aquimarina sp. RZ0]|uniref:acyl carrier protein n=1 Tax=Aquimarina sp. RZ0 TaxID=2607730 RepID=UPI0011F3BD3C|nr:acyl carrier protein [Aquimarina sp. RZ0]KAA1246072.1 acyl carrier protein [Aquimarina sp. RZ0]